MTSRMKKNWWCSWKKKYDQLRLFNKIKEIPVPEHLQDVLRHITRNMDSIGLNYLREIGWGGISADDMGLGKTIQALSYLHYFRHENGKLNALVVCPTTLMFNWENEIKNSLPRLLIIFIMVAIEQKIKSF